MYVQNMPYLARLSHPITHSVGFNAVMVEPITLRIDRSLLCHPVSNPKTHQNPWNESTASRTDMERHVRGRKKRSGPVWIRQRLEGRKSDNNERRRKKEMLVKGGSCGNVQRLHIFFLS